MRYIVASRVTIILRTVLLTPSFYLQNLHIRENRATQKEPTTSLQLPLAKVIPHTYKEERPASAATAIAKPATAEAHPAYDEIGESSAASTAQQVRDDVEGNG
ncbi:hypothetical protein Tcan_16577 [Toxocara canis]|uniref:Uncharacterized protein n=1 Tax=Toxocara canis TaxID=6265 RepID=A0A0B2VGN4_TOXCA|nr:hypothetical protein Tcan_16577 [Toxocara canis]